MKNVTPILQSRENATNSALEMDDDDVPVGRILSRREAMLHLAGLGLAGVSLVVAGCGGGGSGSSALGSASGLTGRAVLTITWPDSTSRLIPTAANSITVAFSLNGTIVSTQTVARPTTGTTSTVTFSSLPVGNLTVTATAYPNADGTGTAQATATTTTAIASGQTTTVNLTMASTIDHLTITPTGPTVSVGGTTTLAVAAYDASGSVVLTASSKISWASSDTTVATVNASSGLVTGIKAGSATITVTESESGKTGTASVTVTGSSSISCVAFPQETEGPYWVDVSLNRSDTRTGSTTDNGANTSTGVQKGIPLTLNFFLANVTSSCAPVSGAQIDIWQCNVNGIYSAEAVESTSTQKFLRGYQTTDSSGKVTFTTIYPGWYSGRTTHIHFRVRFTSGGKSYNLTGQLFFDETTTTQVYKTSDYSSHGQKDTSNASDMVYNSPTSGTGATTLLALTGSTSAGFAATFTMGVSI